MHAVTLANFKFRQDQVFCHNDSHFVIEVVLQKQPHDELYCAPFDAQNNKIVPSKNIIKFNAQTLSTAIMNNDAYFINRDALSDEPIVYTERQKELQKMWSEYIDALLIVADGKLSRAVKDIQKAKLMVDWAKYDYTTPSDSNCQEKVRNVALENKKTYSDGGNSNISRKSLFPMGHHAMKGASRLHPRIEDLILKYIDTQYLISKPKHKVTPARIYRAFKRELEEIIEAESHGKNTDGEAPAVLKVPCIQTFYNKINALDKIVVSLKRLNKKEKTALQRQRNTKFIIDRVLQRVEIDAIHISMGIIEHTKHGINTERKYRGRIVLMVAIDVYSRAIIGYSYHIAPEPGENKDLVLQCIKSILLPKNNPEWGPVFGKPFHIIGDQSTTNTGEVVRETVSALGSVYSTTPSYEPWKKPFIERFFLTLRTDFLSQFDTYLGSKLYRNHDHLNSDDDVKNRVMKPNKKTGKYYKHVFTEEQFVEEFEKYIGIYQNNKHDGLHDRVPLDVWNDSITSDPLNFTQVPENHPIFSRLAMFDGERIVRSDGSVRVRNELYSSPILKQVYGANVKSIGVFMSDVDASFISFQWKGMWHVATLCEANYTPDDSLQRNALDKARDEHLGHLDQKDTRNDYNAPENPQIAKPANKDEEKVDNAIDIDDEGAEKALQAAEHVSAESMPNHYAPTPDECSDYDYSDGTDNNQKRTPNIGGLL